MKTVPFEEFKKIAEIDNTFSAVMHQTGLIKTPRYPSGYGEPQSTGWKNIKGQQYRAICIQRDPLVFEGGIPCPSLNTKWSIERA